MSIEDQKLGKDKKDKVKTEIDWQRDLDRLIDLASILDLPTRKQEFWKTNPVTKEIWKPTEKDVWIEKYLKIRTKKSGRARFELNRAQREYSRRCTRQNIVLKARQVGMTSYIAARFFVQTITNRGALTVQVAHDGAAAEDIFRIVHRFWENLPDQLRKGALKTSRSNVRELVFPRLDSGFAVTSAAENAGRGRTIQNLHCSEVSRWGRDGEEALASLRAAVVPGGDIVLESTPNGAAGLFYEEWQQADATGYTRHFFPWWFDDSYVLEPGIGLSECDEDEKELIRKQKLSPTQIAWRRKQWASFRNLAAQEFAEDPITCFRASGECVFELSAIDAALHQAGNPVETRDNGRLLIWLPAQMDREYVIGVDPAGGGVDGDYSCAQIIDRKLGTQCAELHGHWTPHDLAIKIIALGKEYNTALLAVERNNHGTAVLTCLRIKDYPEIYVHSDDKDGWPTTTATRPETIQYLAEALTDSTRSFRSPRFLQECRTFVRSVDGRTAAGPGAHDDCVIAMAIAWAVRQEEAGRTLKRG
jgi:hypothetical protein